MTRFDFQRAFRLTALALATVGLLTACGPGQGSRSTTVVLTGPPDKVQALVDRYKLLESPSQAHMEKLADGRERATFNKPKGLPLGQLIDLGKDAARDGVSYAFSSGAQWDSAEPSQGAPQPGEPSSNPPARSGGPVV